MKRTEQEKLHLIDQREQSGLLIKTFCCQHNFSDSLFHTWLNKYRRNRKTVKKKQEFIQLQVTPASLMNQVGALYAEVITVKGTQVKFYQPVWMICYAKYYPDAITANESLPALTTDCYAKYYPDAIPAGYQQLFSVSPSGRYAKKFLQPCKPSQRTNTG